MVSKLSINGVAGFLLANGALSGEGSEYSIRKQLIENDLVEAIIYLPRNLFYTTDIGVTLWIISKNKNKGIREINNKDVKVRDRSKEILFIDLRRTGQPFEKKYIEFSDIDIKNISSVYHNWIKEDNSYENIPEYCYSANLDEVRERNYSLVPSIYIEYKNTDEELNFELESENIYTNLKELFNNEVVLNEKILCLLEDIKNENN